MISRLYHVGLLHQFAMRIQHLLHARRQHVLDRRAYNRRFDRATQA